MPDSLFEQIRKRSIARDVTVRFEGCPFVGLAAYQPHQAQLFFGRQKETLDALTCFFDVRPGAPAVRWLEINGNSGSGKSSLMQAGILPLVEQGWLWRPNSRYEHWTPIGPMMPGERPVEMLAESLVQAFGGRMNDVVNDLAKGDNALRFWLRERPERKTPGTAFLLAIDQFEELFTIADVDQRRRFDRLLANALEDADCPLFVLSTVRSDFLDRFAEDLPRLVAVRNRRGRPWTLGPIGDEGLREVIDGPGRLAGLEVDEIRAATIAEARDEPGALPLVENALHYLWERREGNKLVGRLFTEQGGLAGILSRSAGDLLNDLEEIQRTRALELLFRLVRVDTEGYRHARQRMRLDEAVAIAGGGDAGWEVVNRLSGQRQVDRGTSASPLRLIIVTGNADAGTDGGNDRWVKLIHETLIRSKGQDPAGKPWPYWPALWDYIEAHKQRAVWMDRLKADTQIWFDNGKRASDLWSHERVREAVAALGQVGGELHLSPEEQDFLGPTQATAMLAELESDETSHKRRLLIGQRLAVLGELPLRWGVGVDANKTPCIDWCPVPNGDVRISILSDPSDPNSREADARSRRIETFQIARYPVTVAQYCAFMEAEDGWCQEAWWGDDLYYDQEGDTYEFGGFGNHPAVYVSWFDAVAFCRWLSRRLGFEVRLPDEWEWQQAATGGKNQSVFPWGAHWNAKAELWRANTFESRVGQATAVGMYPGGASLTGALDMAGTVWEWCSNKFETAKVEQTRSRHNDFDARVLRGGSWNSDQGNARSAYRDWLDPFYRSYSIGFRVVCSSPSSVH